MMRIIFSVLAVAAIVIVFMSVLMKIERDLNRIANELIELKLNFWKIVVSQNIKWNYGDFSEKD